VNIRNNNGERKFMCDICKKYLNKKGKRNENIRNNNGEKKGV
jgi:hypothetical protein